MPQYADIGKRFVASFIDGVLMGIVNFVLGLIISAALLASGQASAGAEFGSQFISPLLSLSLSVGYYVYFIGKTGQTPGKMAMKIKVVKAVDNSVPGYTTAFLREVVGKSISALVFTLGYLWVLWDSKKQGWHDKIAGTIVVPA